MLCCYFVLIDHEDDRQKFEKLYRTYRLKMHYVAFQILKDEQEAENMVHDTFVTLIEYLDHIEDVECHRTWNYIVTILKNKCFNCLKRQSRIEYTEDHGIFESSGEKEDEMASGLIQKEAVEVLAKCIQELKYPYKEAIYLQYYNGLNSKETAKMLGLSPENVRQITKRARKKLKEMLLETGYRYEE